jgi:hypothetical protein
MPAPLRIGDFDPAVDFDADVGWFVSNKLDGIRCVARFVNDATADLGLNIAGRRVERQTDPTAWLKRLGITLRDL